jgi:hypothetical protein
MRDLDRSRFDPYMGLVGFVCGWAISSVAGLENISEVSNEISQLFNNYPNICGLLHKYSTRVGELSLIYDNSLEFGEKALVRVGGPSLIVGALGGSLGLVGDIIEGFHTGRKK